MTIAKFIAMGGYGPYVWTSYAIVIAVLLVVAASSYWQFKQFFRRRQRVQNSKLIGAIDNSLG